MIPLAHSLDASLHTSPQSEGHASHRAHAELSRGALARVTEMSSVLQTALDIQHNSAASAQPAYHAEPWRIPHTLNNSTGDDTEASNHVVWSTEEDFGDDSGWAVSDQGGDQDYAAESESSYSEGKTEQSGNDPMTPLRDDAPFIFRGEHDAAHNPLDSDGDYFSYGSTASNPYPHSPGFDVDYVPYGSTTDNPDPRSSIDTRYRYVASQTQDFGIPPYHNETSTYYNANTGRYTPVFDQSNFILDEHRDFSVTRPSELVLDPGAWLVNSCNAVLGNGLVADPYVTPTNRPIQPGPNTNAFPQSTSQGSHPRNPRFWSPEPLNPGPLLHPEPIETHALLPVITLSESLVSNVPQESKVAAKTKQLYDKIVKKPLRALANLDFHVAGLEEYKNSEHYRENRAIDKSKIGWPIQQTGTSNMPTVAVQLPRPRAMLDISALNAGTVQFPGHAGPIEHEPAPILLAQFAPTYTARLPLYLVPEAAATKDERHNHTNTKPHYWLEDLCKGINSWLLHPGSKVKDIKLQSITIGSDPQGWHDPVQSVVANIDFNAERIRWIDAKLPPDSRGPLDAPDQPLNWIIAEIVWSFKKKSSSVICMPRRCVQHAYKSSDILQILRVGPSQSPSERVPAVSGYNVDAHKFDSFIKGYQSGIALITVSTERETIF